MMSAAVRSVVLGAFSRPLYTLFANGEDGFLFGNWSELDELFTTSTGATAVAADADPVGMALDDRAWGARTLAEQLAQATELLVAGSWSMSVAGGTSTAVESPAGTLTLTGDGTNTARGDQAITTVVGRTYRIAASNSGAGTASINIGTTQGGTNVLTGVGVSAGQTSAFYFVATSTTTWVRFVRSASFASAVVHSISCKEVGGNHALQTTTTQRAVYRTNNGKPYLSFDGSDDRLVTPFLPTTSLTLAVAANITNIASVALGGGGSTGNVRAQLGVDAAGKAAFGWGSETISAGYGSDIRSQDHVLLITGDGSARDFYLDGAVLASGASTGGPNGNGALALGCNNNNGTPANFLNGRVYAALALNRRVTGAEIALITRRFQRTYQ